MNKRFYLVILCSFFVFNFSFSQTISISGKVLRHNGEPVEGVMVTCTNAPSVMSDAEGNFSFPDLPEGQDYSISGEYETHAFDGITILDELFYRTLILAIITDSVGFHWLSGDVNESGSLGNLDLIYMRRAALRIDNNIPDVYWKFFHKIGNNDIDQNINLANVTEDVSDLELTALKLGDMAIDADYLDLPPDAPEPEYYIENTSLSQDEEFTLEIKANDFKQITGFQHGLVWDANALEFVAFEEADNVDFGVNEAFTMNGEFLISNNRVSSWPEVYNLEDSSTIYSLTFKALQDLNSLEGVIDFSDQTIPQQTVYLDNEDWSLYLVENRFEGVITSVGNIVGLETFELAPNPTHDEIFVNINFSRTENAELALYDVAGRLIRIWKFDGQVFQESISVQEFASGTYVLKLKTNNGTIAKKVIRY